MYGRDRERALLRELLDDTIAGHGGLVLISGEAGIGKTTLVDDLVEQADERGCLVLSGGCYDLTTTPPYGPWVEVIQGYMASAPKDGPDVPSWFGNPDELEKVGSQAALFDDTRSFFAAVADIQPLVIVLEDLHWSDAASLDALRYLSRTLADTAILIIATYRDDEITRHDPLYQLLPTLVRESAGVRVSLQRLNREAIKTFVSSRYHLAAPDQLRLVDHLDRYSEGNPFFLGELLFELENSERLRQEDGRWQLSRLDTIRLPQMVGQMLERRIQRLDADQRRYLEIAAVIGHQVDLDLWQGVTNGTDEELSDTLKTAVASQLLAELETGEGVRFTHALVREAIYSGIVLLRRRSLHRKVAEHLVDRTAPDPDTVASHFVQGGDARAVDWLLRAGVRAERSYAWLTAVRHYEAAQALLEGDHDQALLRGRLLVRLSRLSRYSSPDDMLPYLETALQIARDVKDETLEMACKFQIAFLHVASRPLAQAINELDAATTEVERLSLQRAAPLEHLFTEGTRLDEEPQADQSTFRSNSALEGLAPPRGTVATNLANVGRFREAHSMAGSFVHACEAAFGDDREGLLAFARDGLLALFLTNAAFGQFDAAVEYLEQDREGLRLIKNHLLLGWTLTNSLLYYQLRYRADHLTEPRELLREARTEFEHASGFRPEHTTVMPGVFWYHRHTGDWNRAEDEARLILDGQGWNVGTNQPAVAVLALLDRDRGRRASAWERILDLLPDGPATDPGNVVFWPALTLQQAAVGLTLDDCDHESAQAWIEAYHHWLDWSGATLGRSEGQWLWGRYYRETGSLGHARDHATRAVELASEPRQPLALIAAFRLLGQLDVDEGLFDDARRRLQAALELAERCEALFEQAQTLLVMAELAAKTDDVDKARRLLARVRAICEPLGAKPTLERAELIEATLPKRRASNAEYPAGLTQREVEVLRLVAEGMTDAEVAEDLFISPRTVGQHLRSVYNKLGVNSRVEATRFAVEAGLLVARGSG